MTALRALLLPVGTTLVTGCHAPRETATTSTTNIEAPSGAIPAETRLHADRHAMVRTILEHARSSGLPISERVQRAIENVPRHEFVPASVRAEAYGDSPLPIGHAQTISQPFIVALMTELARVEPDDVVLEIGTGSGYQAAVLAGLAKDIYTIEIVEPLGLRAKQTLGRLGYANVHVRIGDGYKGWPEHSPFDAILVTAGAEHIPDPLVEQLAPGGKLVIPVGENTAGQDLTVLEKQADGSLKKTEVLPVRFVPLTRSRD